MRPLVLYLDTAQGIIVFLALLVCVVYTVLAGVDAWRDWRRGRKRNTGATR